MSEVRSGKDRPGKPAKCECGGRAFEARLNEAGDVLALICANPGCRKGATVIDGRVRIERPRVLAVVEGGRDG